MLSMYKLPKTDISEFSDKKVSIVMPTMRQDPKFDIILTSLKNQTHQNFEFIIVDLLYKQRINYIKELSKKYEINIIHVEDKPWPHLGKTMGFSNAVNTGIINSSGDYFVEIDDCTFYQHKWLEKHLQVATNNFLSLGSRYFIYSLDFSIINFKEAKIEIPNTKDLNVATYIKEQAGFEQYLSLTFGNKTIFSPQDYRLLGIPKEIIESDDILLDALPGWSYGGNICISMDMLLNINGYDQEYDMHHSYGYADCDLGIRLHNKKCKSFINPSNWMLQISDKDHVSIFDTFSDLKKENLQNQKLYEQTCANNKTWVNLDINLRKEREKILKERHK